MKKKKKPKTPKKPVLNKHNILCTLNCYKGRCDCGYVDSGSTGDGQMG